MKLSRHIGHRTISTVAIAGAAVLLPAVALAASGSVAAQTTAHTTAATSSTRIGRCLTAQLDVWLGWPGGVALGTTYYELEISNVSRSTCTLYGYPGVSALSGTAQLGSAAGRDSEHRDTLITLTPGSTTHAILAIAEAGNYPPSTCRPREANALRVFAPGDFGAHLVPFQFEGCARRGPVYLQVTATVPGTGIPNHSN
jgi:hypothetical protein